MYLDSLKLSRVRNLNPSNLKLNPHINFIFGENGSGKTSFLESISILSSGHSFRSRNIKKVILNSAEDLVISGSAVNTLSDRIVPIGIQRFRSGSTHISVDSQRESKLSVLSKTLPTLAVDASSFEFIEGAPSNRRSVLDWGLFHVEHSYLGFMQSYKKALLQKNTLLRSYSSKDESSLLHWNKILANIGESIHRLRIDYINGIVPFLTSMLEKEFNLNESITISYLPGWNEQKYSSLLDCLTSISEKEIYRKSSLAGPQRGDLSIKFNGVEAKDICSRGQKKLVLYGVRLAQIEYMASITSKCPILLLDDLPSELDERNQKKILDYLARFNCQVFITAIDSAEIVSIQPESHNSYAMFHVEHGKIIEK